MSVGTVVPAELVAHAARCGARVKRPESATAKLQKPRAKT